MVDLLDEISQDLRQEKVMQFWKKAGGYFALASLAIVAVVGGSTVWRHYQESQRKEATEIFLKAQNLSKTKDWDQAATTWLSLKEKKDIAGIASLSAAHAQIQAGDYKKALEIYQALANNLQAEAGTRVLGRIYAVPLMAETGADYASVEAWLDPILKADKSPFYALAKEQLAYAALGLGKLEQAKSLLTELAEAPETPHEIRERAKSYAPRIAVNQKGA